MSIRKLLKAFSRTVSWNLKAGKAPGVNGESVTEKEKQERIHSSNLKSFTG